jgi:deoxyribose-phosphate aldolase
MNEPDAEAQPQLTYEDIAGMLEHAMLAPEATDADVRAACELAREYRIAAVIVRPCDAEVAVRWREGSGVAVASVVGHPYGFSTTPAKLYEARDLLRRGVTEIDAYASASKMIAREFQFIETEMQQIATSCREAGAGVTVTFPSALLAPDLKTIACKIVKRVGAAYIRVAVDDIGLAHRLCGERVAIASSGAENLADVLAMREAGAATIATKQILDAWKAEIAARPTTPGNAPAVT